MNATAIRMSVRSFALNFDKNGLKPLKDSGLRSTYIYRLLQMCIVTILVPKLWKH